MLPSHPSPGLPQVSSLGEHLRPYVRELTQVSPEALQHWLPNLSVPAGWHEAPVQFEHGQPARVLTRRKNHANERWIGCDVVNLIQYSGSVPDSVIRERAKCTLEDLGARAPLTYRVSVPSGLGIAAIRCRATVDVGRSLWVQITNYVVDSGNVGALIEHTTLVDARSRSELTAEISGLGEQVRSTLVASVSARVPRPGIPDEIVNHPGYQQNNVDELTGLKQP